MSDAVPQQGDTLAALAKDVKDTCGIVYAQLTDHENRDGTPEQRIELAANEVRELFHRTEARMVFHDAWAPATEMPDTTQTNVRGQIVEGDVCP